LRFVIRRIFRIGRRTDYFNFLHDAGSSCSDKLASPLVGSLENPELENDEPKKSRGWKMQHWKMSDESAGLEFDGVAMRDRIKLIRCTNKAQQCNELVYVLMRLTLGPKRYFIQWVYVYKLLISFYPISIDLLLI